MGSSNHPAILNTSKETMPSTKSPEPGRQKRGRFSTGVSYNVYSTVNSISSDSSYSVYDTVSSTATALTQLGGSQDELHLHVGKLENPATPRAGLQSPPFRSIRAR